MRHLAQITTSTENAAQLNRPSESDIVSDTGSEVFSLSWLLLIFIIFAIRLIYRSDPAVSQQK